MRLCFTLIYSFYLMIQTISVSIICHITVCRNSYIRQTHIRCLGGAQKYVIKGDGLDTNNNNRTNMRVVKFTQKEVRGQQELPQKKKSSDNMIFNKRRICGHELTQTKNGSQEMNFHRKREARTWALIKERKLKQDELPHEKECTHRT